MEYPFVLVKNNQQLVGARKVFVLARRNGARFVDFSSATKFSSEDAAQAWLKRTGAGGVKIVKVTAVSS
jgi:hypothetical protein